MAHVRQRVEAGSCGPYDAPEGDTVMIVVKAKFDGQQVVFPKGFEAPPAGDVVVVFDAGDWDTRDPAYLAMLDETLAKAWDNPDDEVFNDM